MLHSHRVGGQGGEAHSRAPRPRGDRSRHRHRHHLRAQAVGATGSQHIVSFSLKIRTNSSIHRLITTTTTTTTTTTPPGRRDEGRCSLPEGVGAEWQAPPPGHAQTRGKGHVSLLSSLCFMGRGRDWGRTLTCSVSFAVAHCGLFCCLQGWVVGRVDVGRVFDRYRDDFEKAIEYYEQVSTRCVIDDITITITATTTTTTR